MDIAPYNSRGTNCNSSALRSGKDEVAIHDTPQLHMRKIKKIDQF